ncbi:MAG: aminotransferase class V-fold PLP-dependent enzyme, partial [Planctomycetes bacterium]|nr:aminotransferase class V-fold PLP-dependent enzyme [Planctomycetota bacterium]
VNFFNCDVDWHYLDLLSLSGHKIYGPKGIGALYVRSGVRLKAQQTGGHHEKNLRSGTLNTPGIVGLGAALAQLGTGEKGEPSPEQNKNNQQIAKLRDKLIKGVMKNIPDVVLNTDRSCATPAHANFSFLGVEGESILISLDLEGTAVSTGSACASGSLKASPVLLAMGIKQEVAHNSIRFSLGKNNTEKEIDQVIAELPSIIKKLRAMNPLYK